MSTTIRFVNTKFTECVELCTTLDKKCFPQEMWLADEEINGLLKADAQATTVSCNGKNIGLSITMSENEASALLDSSDALFTPQKHGAYSYSEAIHPDFQNHGIGSLLLRETKFFIARIGYKTLSAHVRRKNGWDTKREKGISLIEKRLVENFWPLHMQEPVMFQHGRV